MHQYFKLLVTFSINRFEYVAIADVPVHVYVAFFNSTLYSAARLI